jgi:hypothetical protein
MPFPMRAQSMIDTWLREQPAPDPPQDERDLPDLASVMPVTTWRVMVRRADEANYHAASFALETTP